MKKGFTLAEILAVIVIIGLLLILILPPVINRISSSSDEAKETENEFIYSAADIYIREHPEKYPPGKSGKYCILIQELIDDGKLVEPVNDVVTGENLSDKSVLVTIYSTGTKEYEIKEGAECKDIAALPMIDFIIDPVGSTWVKKRTVTIIYPTLEGEYQARYRREDENSNNWINDNAYNKGGKHTNIVFNKSSKSTKIEAQLKGNQIISGRVNVVNVDSEAPTITSITQSGKSGNGLKVNITAKDNLSGLDGIYFNTVKSTPNVNASGWIEFTTNDTSSKTYSKTFSTGTYYVYVKDKAGNISAGSKNGITISNATYHSGYYYCPSGYNQSGSGSSMTCYQTSTRTPTHHPRVESCSYPVTTVYSYCDDYRQRCGSTSSRYTKSGSTCIGNWVNVTGRTEWACDGDESKQCATNCQNKDGYQECDSSTYKEKGILCPEGQTTGTVPHNPTVMCRNKYPVKVTEEYWTCPSGYTPSRSSIKRTCTKTTYKDPYYSPPYYSCSSGSLVNTNMCFRSRF